MFNSKEIRELEKVFGFLYSNDEERLAVIQCDETKDIVACPGSGKTTCLAAKLYLLSKRIPFKNGSGICVLAHTNNTIDEIKKKLESKADVYTSYPNFLGTIQSFVDRFLAIPANIEYFGKRPDNIEAERYERELEYEYNKLDWEDGSLKKLLYARFKKDEDTANDIVNKQKDYCKLLRFDLKNNIIKAGIGNSRTEFKNDTPTKTCIIELITNLWKNGILHYDDAYLLAEKYLDEYSTILKPTFSKRFKFVFIDEIQDTAEYQLEIIDKCFDDSVVIQRFGDPNQAIFSHAGVLKADKDWIIRDNGPLHITSSKRFRESNAQVVNRLGLEAYENPMCGEGECEEEHSPIIITFKNDNIEKTLEAFAKIIEEKELNGIDAEKRKPFKAVGWVAKERDDDKLIIGSYYKKFIRHKIKQRKEFDCLDGYAKACEYIDLNKEGLKVFKDNIFRCLARALREGECKFNNRYLTATKLEEKLHEDHKSSLTQLRIKVVEWCDAILHGRLIKDKLKDYIESDFSDLFENFDPDNIQEFLTQEYKGEFEYSINKSDENKVIYDSVEIEISTIHGAKGQTHEATLYLETFYKKNDIEDIIEFLKANSTPSNDTQKCRLKMAYVGMSRPRSLLCVAARGKSIEGHEDDLKNAGWEIRSVNEILK